LEILGPEDGVLVMTWMARSRAVAVVMVVGVMGTVCSIRAAAPRGAMQDRGAGALSVEIAMEVGGRAYTVKGPGECNVTRDASIFEAPATMWSARQSVTDRNINFTMWRTRKNVDMLTLWVTIAGKTHRVNTVKLCSG
jgi:hypothetical protein